MSAGASHMLVDVWLLPGRDLPHSAVKKPRNTHSNLVASGCWVAEPSWELCRLWDLRTHVILPQWYKALEGEVPGPSRYVPQTGLAWNLLASVSWALKLHSRHSPSQSAFFILRLSKLSLDLLIKKKQFLGHPDVIFCFPLSFEGCMPTGSAPAAFRDSLPTLQVPRFCWCLWRLPVNRHLVTPS